MVGECEGLYGWRVMGVRCLGVESGGHGGMRSGGGGCALPL